jgi:hypothetical protein
MLSPSDIQKLRAHYFTPKEISDLNTATTSAGNQQYINLESEGWRNALERRLKWAQRFQSAGGTKQGFQRTLQRFYDAQNPGEDSVFIFLRAEYNRYTRSTKVDYNTAAANRAAKQINKKLRNYSGKPREYTVGR